MQNKLRIVGKTTNDEFVLAGIFHFKETYGLPLVIMMDYFEKYNMKISIIHYIDEALRAGQRLSGIKAELIETLNEKFGKNNWEGRIDALGSTK